MATLDEATYIAQIIRDRRKTLGLTHEQVAEMAGCGTLFIVQLEEGKPGVRLYKLVPVLKALGLTLTIS